MSEEQEWNGRERRKTSDRRQTPDRRQDIRFEPGNPDRRKNRGRRKEDKDPWQKSLEG
ncbi:hypothetical protein GCM10009104_03310 [Marinobacterium maritimum]|uniref:Uncharacterized protein n=1 Tax=Marinobacterium maritimum TaxID=500162 RepID=A0ABP3T809_9GAMM